MGNKQSKSTCPRPLLRARIELLWVVSNSPYRVLSPNVIRETCRFTPLDQPKLIKLTQFSVQCQDLTDRTWLPLISFKKRLDLYHNRSLAWLNDNRIFVCGGLSKKYTRRSAYEISMNAIEKLRNMRQGRYHHGIAYEPISNSVFVFGGCHTTTAYYSHTSILLSIEQYRLSTQRWTSHQGMLHTRYCFQPCCHAFKIVICGGEPLGSCEIFDQFTGISKKLSFTCNPGSAFALDNGETLITYSSHLIQWWSLASPEIVLQKHSEDKLWCPCPPVYVGGKTYFYLL